MFVRHVSLVGFRSYPDVEVELAAGTSVLVGLNGHGKTNLVEAIGYAASLSSHRVATDAPLVHAGLPQAIVRVVVVRDGRDSLIELELNPGRANRARLNKVPLTRPRDVLGTLRTVLFAPEDLALVKGDPAERRRFLDDLLVARQPRWAGVRSEYERVLKQRNALLKSAAPLRRRGGGGGGRAAGAAAAAGAGGAMTAGRAAASEASSRTGGATPESGDIAHTLDVWNDQLASIGSQIVYGRLRLLRDLGGYLASAYAAVSSSSAPARVTYRASLAAEAAAAVAEGTVPEPDELRRQLLDAIAEVRSSELDRGISLVGPHRDDVLLHLGDLPAKGYASHGESWSFALGLKLAAYRLLRHDLGDDPVLILDDVFAELDVERRARLAELVADCEQVIVTAAVPADVPAALVARGSQYAVTPGEVGRVEA